MNDNITLVVIDSYQYKATEWAINHTRKFFPNNPLVVISDQDFYPARTKFVQVPKFNKQQHSLICLAGVTEHVETTHALFIQWDGMPAHADNWRDEFMDYDYIGAPWPWYPEPYTVGNGGFSLRSKKLLELTPMLHQEFGREEWRWLEDGMIGITFRDWLVSQGIKFAPTELAAKFSREHPHAPTDSFGFHHRITANHYLTQEQLLEWTPLIL